MAGIEDVGARTGGPRATGSYIGDHRYIGRDDLLDNAAHGGIQPAGGVHPDDGQFRLLLFSVFKAPFDIVSSSGADAVLNLQHNGDTQTFRCLRRSKGKTPDNQPGNHQIFQ